jgi:mannose-6-phosphate isomerase-like protein (cupin superfamily)
MLCVLVCLGVLPARASDPVTYVGRDATAAAFAKGQPLVETATYKVHASRRDADGLVEVHANETDIVYVLDGRATLVTGGRVVNPRQTTATEIRGESVDGGTTRALEPGDVVIVPQGVPHWFRDVRGPFVYYVVKVIGGAAVAP